MIKWPWVKRVHHDELYARYSQLLTARTKDTEEYTKLEKEHQKLKDDLLKLEYAFRQRKDAQINPPKKTIARKCWYSLHNLMRVHGIIE